MSKYRCPKCNKMIPVDKSSIKAGDKVNILIERAKRTSRSTSIRYSSKKVTVVEVNNDLVKVRFGSNIEELTLDDVTPADAPNTLTYAFIGMCECGGDAC
ncbi:hypothetical protein [Candidatus Symbiopectobacterium sp. NZEC135]|uniref:hypothetical protein n=1 Tax=Candidatus Symbiopectobacterium sp. NZEC135 TaxID=2820471 RepID=UPI002226E671|nr:hypothetical protein [Candidatus Symbiopectobacterium sp. NZEC135]MCW2478869.1 hypothetical protein [Candidatus Symbiopectobacterium sp. NZEC135]